MFRRTRIDAEGGPVIALVIIDPSPVGGDSTARQLIGKTDGRVVAACGLGVR